MIDREKINLTFERIEKSLDLRFQKKGALFITKSDLEEAKKSIYKEEYQNFFALSTKVGMPVLIQILLKNPWLITNKALTNRDLKKQLNISLQEENGKQYLKLLQKISQDEVFSTKRFKEYCEEKYYSQIDVSICNDIYKNNEYKPAIRALCFKRLVLSSSKDGKYKILKINNEFLSYDGLYKQVKNSSYLNDILINSTEKKYIATWILENKCRENMDAIWSNSFLSLEEHAFNEAVNYIRLNMEYSDFTTKWIFRKIIPKLLQNADKKEKDIIESYVDKIFDLYSNRSAYRIKILFLNMLEPAKFKNKELAIRLLDGFEERGISEKFEDKIKKIRSGKIPSKGYVSAEKAYEDLSGGQDLSKKGSLNFFSMQFSKTKYHIIKELYEKYNENKNVKKSISYFIADSMKINNKTLLTMLKPLLDEYKTQIINYIARYSINTVESRKFLHENNEDKILSEFTKR